VEGGCSFGSGEFGCGDGVLGAFEVYAVGSGVISQRAGEVGAGEDERRVESAL